MGRSTAPTAMPFCVDSVRTIQRTKWRNVMHGNSDDNTRARHTIGWKFKNETAQHSWQVRACGRLWCVCNMRKRQIFNPFIHYQSQFTNAPTKRPTISHDSLQWIYMLVYLIARSTIRFVNYSFRTRLTRLLFTLTLWAENETQHNFLYFSLVPIWYYLRSALFVFVRQLPSMN